MRTSVFWRAMSVAALLVISTSVFPQSGLKVDNARYLSWNPSIVDAITKKFRVNGLVSKFALRITTTERARNYKLRATWFTPEMIRASARYWQVRERLNDSQTQALVDEAERAGDTVVMIELDPNEGSGVIPSNWLAVLRAKGGEVEAKGLITPDLRSAKALVGTVQRDYAYDVFWVVFPLTDQKGNKIFPDIATEAELVVLINNMQGKVRWAIPESIRERLKR